MDHENEFEGYCRGCKHYGQSELNEPCLSCENGSEFEGSSRVNQLANMPIESVVMWSFASGALIFGIAGFIIGSLA
jgi:hypothetical protein